MGELSNLLTKDILTKYKVELTLTPAEYKILLFNIESIERNYPAKVPLHRDFLGLKEKLITNHITFNTKNKRKFK